MFTEYTQEELEVSVRYAEPARVSEFNGDEPQQIDDVEVADNSFAVEAEDLEFNLDEESLW